MNYLEWSKRKFRGIEWWETTIADAAGLIIHPRTTQRLTCGDCIRGPYRKEFCLTINRDVADDSIACVKIMQYPESLRPEQSETPNLQETKRPCE